jgi:hypothetical protein
LKIVELAWGERRTGCVEDFCGVAGLAVIEVHRVIQCLLKLAAAKITTSAALTGAELLIRPATISRTAMGVRRNDGSCRIGLYPMIYDEAIIRSLAR